jgi:hypothetical protein
VLPGNALTDSGIRGRESLQVIRIHDGLSHRTGHWKQASHLKWPICQYLGGTQSRAETRWSETMSRARTFHGIKGWRCRIRDKYPVVVKHISQGRFPWYVDHRYRANRSVVIGVENEAVVTNMPRERGIVFPGSLERDWPVASPWPSKPGCDASRTLSDDILTPGLCCPGAKPRKEDEGDRAGS